MPTALGWYAGAVMGTALVLLVVALGGSSA